MRDRILIVDDEAAVCEILSHHLSNSGFRCDSVTDPLEALERLARSPYDLLVTDLRMPNLSGIDLVDKTKALDPDIAIVVVTALTDVTAAIQAIRVGADDYVLKPFNLQEITSAVNSALEKRQLVLDNRAMRTQLEQRVQRATSELEAANAQLRKTTDYLESLIHSTGDAIATISKKGQVEFVNNGALRMLGYERDDLAGANVARFLPDGKSEVAYLRRVLRKRRYFQSYETELLRKDGTSIPVIVTLSLVRDAERDVTSAVAVCKDVTKQKRLEAELKEMSIKDSLTGLYNQRYFYDRLRSEIERARRQRHPLSLLLFDVDQFKVYNDAHGHLEGDRVLQTVGGVVMECTRDHVDIGFRYGGDEFTVILPEATEEEAVRIAERIRKSFEAKNFDHLTLSMGVMAYKLEYSIRTFIQFTDSLMYDAKRSGGNRVYVYEPERDLDSGFEGSMPAPKVTEVEKETT